MRQTVKRKLWWLGLIDCKIVPKNSTDLLLWHWLRKHVNVFSRNANCNYAQYEDVRGGVGLIIRRGHFLSPSVWLLDWSGQISHQFVLPTQVISLIAFKSWLPSLIDQPAICHLGPNVVVRIFVGPQGKFLVKRSLWVLKMCAHRGNNWSKFNHIC